MVGHIKRIAKESKIRKFLILAIFGGAFGYSRSLAREGDFLVSGLVGVGCDDDDIAEAVTLMVVNK